MGYEAVKKPYIPETRSYSAITMLLVQFRIASMYESWFLNWAASLQVNMER
jgi:hypothetical protein